MSITENQIITALEKVVEPDLGKDIISLKLVSNLLINNGKISFSLQMKNAAMHARKRMIYPILKLSKALPSAPATEENKPQVEHQMMS